MQSSPPTYIRPLLALTVMLGCQLEAVAATGISACDDQANASVRSQIMLVDYNSDEPSAVDPSELLRDPPAIESSALPLTSRIDTTVRRDDNVKADVELPVKNTLEAKPDAAAILLERRNSRLREASDEKTTDMNTELPGMDENEMLQFRQQMYRTDI